MILKILISRADIVQNALIGICVFAIEPRRPDEAWYRVDDLTKLVFAFPNGPLRLSSIINIDFTSLVIGGTAAAHGWRSVALPRFRLLSRPFAACSGAHRLSQCRRTLLQTGITSEICGRRNRVYRSICDCKTPDYRCRTRVICDRFSRFSHRSISALPPKADHALVDPPVIPKNGPVEVCRIVPSH